MLDAAAHEVLGIPLRLPTDVLANALDPDAIVATRTGLGGAAPGPVNVMISECREMLADMQGWHEQIEQRLTRAERSLIDQACQLAESSANGRLDWQCPDPASEKTRLQ